MAIDVVMPQMGESIFEGTITKWLKKPGDTVARDEPLFEISTDKVDAEIPSPAAGILQEIKVGEGQTVPIQTVVAVIDVAAPGVSRESRPATDSAPPKEENAPVMSSSTKKAPSPSKPDISPQPSADASETPPVDTRELAGSNDRRTHASPLVKRLAQENNLDLSTLQGTGAGGRISKNDVLAAISAAAKDPASVSAKPVTASQLQSGSAARATIESAVPRERIYFGHYEAQPMSVMRQRIAEHMVLSKRVSPHVYSIDEADMTHISQIRATAKAEFEERHNTKLTFMAFFVRVCIGALRDFPTVNASTDGTNLVLHGEVNIGIAVALNGGLIVPVLKNAAEKNFLGLQRAINDLAERARSKKLKPEEVQESTFSITNPGIFGGLMGLPIINQPNAAILGIGAIQKRPVVVDDAIAIRSMVYLTLSYDHRIVDGAIAHQFMGQIKKRLETWSEDVL